MPRGERIGESRSQDADGYVLWEPRAVFRDRFVWYLNVEGVSLSRFIARVRRSRGSLREAGVMGGRMEVKVRWREG